MSALIHWRMYLRSVVALLWCLAAGALLPAVCGAPSLKHKWPQAVATRLRSRISRSGPPSSLRFQKP